MLSDVYEMLRDIYKSVRLVGDYSRRYRAAVRNARVPNDKLHRVTAKRLAETDRRDLHGLC